MNMLLKIIYGTTLFVLCSYIVPLQAENGNVIAQPTGPAQAVQGQVQPSQYYPPPPYYGTQAQYYYNQNNPYANTATPYGFYGGFYGSPPPPTPSQAFPDKAAADNLYRYIQNR